MCAKQLGAPPFAIPYSSENAEGKEAVIKRIGDILEDYKNAESENQENNNIDN